MMRDWKQSEERHPCRRTVIGGLVGLLLSGTWLRRVCRSSSKPPLLFTYQGHSDLVGAVAWSPDGKHIVSGSNDKTVQVWNAADGSNVFTYKGHSESGDAVAWSPDGKRIASSSGTIGNSRDDHTVQVWDAADGGNVFTYKGHSIEVKAVAWSPDGKRIASGSWDDSAGVECSRWRAVSLPIRGILVW